MNDEQIKNMFENHEQRILQLEAKFASTTIERIVDEKKQSIAEFILDRKPTSDTQKTLCIGYFLEHKNNLVSFTVSDIEQGFKDAKEKIPYNISDQVYKNIAKGHMMETKEKKESARLIKLTSSGDRFVENNFKKQK